MKINYTNTSFRLTLTLIMLIFVTAMSFGQSTVIYSENFDNQDGKGANGTWNNNPNINLNGVDWTIDVSSADLRDDDWFKVRNKRLEARNTDGEVIWYSPLIDISNYSQIYFSLNASESGRQESDDYFITEYRINNSGNWIEASNNGNLSDDFSTRTVSQLGLSGAELQIRVKIKNSDDEEYHYLDDIIVDVQPLFFEDFEDEDEDDEDGTDLYGTDWNSNKGNNTDWLEVREGNYFEARDTDATVSWFTDQINITDYTNLSLSFNLSTNKLDSEDFIRINYKLDNGSIETSRLIRNDYNDVVEIDLSSISGNTLEIIIEFSNNENNEYHRIDNIKLTGIYNACEAPTASFNSSATVVDTTQEVSFTNTSTNAVSYIWNFGDGSNTSTTVSPTHTFTTAGTYTVTLTATGCNESSSTTTQTVTVYTPGNCSAAGSILMERYDGIGGTSISNLTGSANYPQNPSSVAQLTSFEIPTNTGNDYGVRVSGYICAPQTGYYTFWIASDDNGQLNLSSDENPANATTIATVVAWTQPQQWDKYPAQKSNPILLVAGKKYYVEALMKEAGGGDNLAVGWAKPGQPTSAPSEVIPGSVLSPKVSRTDIAVQDFDGATPNWSYTTSSNDGSVVSDNLSNNTDDYWKFIGEGECDFDSTNPNDFTAKTIAFNELDINYYENAVLSFNYYNSSTEVGDSFIYKIYYNGESTPSVTSSDLTEGSSSSSWETVTVNIPENTSSLKVDFIASLNCANDVVALDNVKVQADAINTWTGVGETNEDIEDEELWSYGITPDSTSTIMIRSGKHLIIKDNRKFKTVIVDAGAFLTITKAGSLTTIKDFIVKDGGTVDMLSELANRNNPSGPGNNNGAKDEFASLVIGGEASGKINYLRAARINRSPDNNNSILRSYISSPVVNETFDNTFINSGTALATYLSGPFVFSQWVAANNVWSHFDPTSSTPHTMLPGKGYLVGMEPTQGNTVPHLKFTGDIQNNDEVTINVNGTGASSWEVLGNPYAGYLDIEQFIVHNQDAFLGGSNAGIYAWTGTGGNTVAQRYKVWNKSNAKLLRPGQGFTTRINGATTVTFKKEWVTIANPAMIDTDFSGRSATPAINDYVVLHLSSPNQFTMATEVYFNTHGTNGLDVGYDTEVYGGQAGNNFGIYTHLVENSNNKDMAIQTLDYNNMSAHIIPLGINLNAGMTATISLADLLLPENTTVYLEDRVANVWTILNNVDYTFTAVANLTNTGRFFIHFEDNSATLSNNEFDLNKLDIRSLAGQKTVVVKGQLNSDSVLELYDIMGRKVLTKSLESYQTTHNIDASQLPVAAYIVKVSNNTQTISKQILIN